jgi:nitrite reductase (NADH) large subunit
VIVDDSDGIAQALDAAMEAATAAVRDPWLERAAPATPNQFAAPIPVEA